MVLVEHYFQVLAILFQINSFEFSRLIISSNVIIQREMSETSETNVDIPRRDEVCGPEAREIWSIGKQFNATRNLALVNEELYLLQMHQTGELQDNFLGVNAKTLTLPAHHLALIFV
jgi:hypothetical protein